MLVDDHECIPGDAPDLNGLPPRGEDGGKGKIKTNTPLGQIPGKSAQ